MKFTAKIQEKRKGGKREPDTKQRFIFLPSKAPFKKGDKVEVKLVLSE